jgi:putative heme-binding domain-containing protein
MRALQAAVLLAACSLGAQDHEYTPGDIAEGRQRFLANCSTCHGPEGATVPGVDLGHGQFRRAATDDDLVRIIQNGIPDTAMPPTPLGDFQARTIVAYMRFMAESASTSTLSEGDPARGKILFEGKGDCTSCHRVRDIGSRLGPDLTDIGSIRRSVELEQSILEPNAEVLPQNRFYTLVKRDGTRLRGRLLNQDTFSVQLIDSNQALLGVAKSDLREHGFADGSPMPSYRGRLTSEELSDLVAYLVSLKGR